MNILVFNLCLLLGWLLVLVGGILIHPGWGLAVAGAVLLFLTFAGAYFAGLFAPKQSQPDNRDGDA